MRMRLLFFIGLIILATSAISYACPYESIVISDNLDMVTIQSGYTAEKIWHPITMQFYVRDIPDEKAQERTFSFNVSATRNHVSGKIVNCDSIVEIPGGRENHSYGGFCHLKQSSQNRTIAICNAEMTNMFKYQFVDTGFFIKRDLIKFVIDNCMGG